jgi:hypothetical protein
MEDQLFDDLMQACREALAYSKGELELKTVLWFRGDTTGTEARQIATELVAEKRHVAGEWKVTGPTTMELTCFACNAVALVERELEQGSRLSGGAISYSCSALPASARA